VSRAVGLAGIAAKLGDIDRQAALQPRARRRRSDGEESEPDSVDEFTALRARVLRLVAAKPRYETGFYDSTGCEPVGNERATFKRRLARQRQDVSAKDMLVSLLPRAEWDKVRRATDEQAALGALRALMERARGRPRLLPHNTMLHFCTYSPEVGSLPLLLQAPPCVAVAVVSEGACFPLQVGFRVAVDGANNLPCRNSPSADRFPHRPPAAGSTARDLAGRTCSRSWCLAPRRPAATLGPPASPSIPSSHQTSTPSPRRRPTRPLRAPAPLPRHTPD